MLLVHVRRTEKQLRILYYTQAEDLYHPRYWSEKQSFDAIHPCLAPIDSQRENNEYERTNADGVIKALRATAKMTFTGLLRSIAKRSIKYKRADGDETSGSAISKTKTRGLAPIAS